MGKAFHFYFAVSLWAPGIIVGALAWGWSISPHVNLTVDGFIPVATLLVTLVGLSVSILTGVYTAVYVYARMKRESGFNQFFSSLSGLIEMTQSIHAEMRGNQVQSSPEYSVWLYESENSLARLREVKPSWKGYRTDCCLEQQLVTYSNSFEDLTVSSGEEFQGSSYPPRFERFLKGVLLGLLTMEESIQGQLLSQRLTWLLTSFLVLLGLSFIVRIVAELRLGEVGPGWATSINLVLAAGLATTLFMHTLIAMFVIWEWQKQVRKRDDAWG